MKPADRRSLRLVVRTVLTIASSTFLLTAATSTVPAQSTPLAQSPDSKGYTLRVTTREVVVEVVARDHNNQPVNDLTRGDFEIFEGAHKSKDDAREISGFRTIDPDAEQANPSSLSRSVVLPLGGRCEIRSTVHYELAFHPGDWGSGYHVIRVNTTRHHIQLTYRAQFYIGVTDIAAHPVPPNADKMNTELAKAACYHSDVPPSILLSAIRIKSQDTDDLHYEVKVRPDSLGLAGIDQDSHHVQLEYGVCTFNRSGHVIDYWHFSENRPLNPGDLNTVLDSGWQESVKVPLQKKPALARFVVLEPRSGNLGAIELSTNLRTPADETNEPEEKEPSHTLVSSEDPNFRTITSRSLGSDVPRPGALCGDVYELPTTTSFLPSDFKTLNAVGAVYANSLNVSESLLKQGLPGSTPRSEWFGIDYYGEFWISKPGKYQFTLNADDGADLYIDDHMLINDDGIHPPRTRDASITLAEGRHTIHLPYFQGPTYVNLILQIKSPDGTMKVFNVRDFARPSPKQAP